MPDFTLKPTFPIASVIDAAQRNNALQEQAREAGNKSLVEGLQSIGQIGQSLYDTKIRVAQALASAKMFGQTPQGQQMLGTNQVTATPQGPVTQNQTAAFDPTTGSVTPNQSQVSPNDIAMSMFGMAPKDVFENQVQQRAAQTAQGELALKQQTEPKRLAMEQKRNTIEEGIQSMLAGLKGQEVKTNAARAENENLNTLLQRRQEAAANLPTGWFSSINNDKGDQAKQTIAEIDAKLAEMGYSPTGLPAHPHSGKKAKTQNGVSYTVNN